MGVSAPNHTLALGILRGLSEFCGKERTGIGDRPSTQVNPTADGRRYTQISISQKIAKITKAELEDLLLRLSAFVALVTFG
jgi:hypothetical protein